MAFKVVIVEDAVKDLEKIPQEEARKILERIEKLLPVTALHEKQLKGRFKGLRRMRAGNYRIIFAIQRDTISVLQIADRKEIYRG